MTERPRLTAIVTTYNEEKHIGACLASLAWCDELLVVDSFSTDRTREIAAEVPGVRLYERPYLGAASQNNWAIDRARHDWVLLLDADERCTGELRREIEGLLERGPEHGAYRIPRRAWVLGKRIRYCGWQTDRVTRFFRRDAARFANRRAHARVLVRGSAPLLTGALEHFMVDDVHEWQERMVRYGYWGAAQAWRDKRRAGLYDVLVRPAWRFFRGYVLRLGFLDGARGVVFCWTQAFACHSKWSLLWSWTQAAARGAEPALPVFEEDASLFWSPEEEASASRA